MQVAGLQIEGLAHADQGSYGRPFVQVIRQRRPATALSCNHACNDGPASTARLHSALT